MKLRSIDTSKKSVKDLEQVIEEIMNNKKFRMV